MMDAAELKANAPKGSVIEKMSIEAIETLIYKAAQQDKAAKRAREIGLRLRIKNSLLVAKARKAGITVTKEEVEKEIKRRKL